ncbi:MAG: MerR family transcriptional regulator [Clostridia bacterium]|nr:MerR family transcriptional regulator [Clostridia bacterium]
MKMKKACEATALTERAIRLYISKGLIIPCQKDGLIDFSPEDIQHLRDIALLRQLDFSMEQIAGMQDDAANIVPILAARAEAARAGEAHEQEVAALLAHLAPESCAGLHGVADGIRANRVSPVLNFTQFDEITSEERHLESLAASKAVDRQQKRQHRLNRLMAACGILTVVLVIAGIFLSSTRIEGYLPVSPITVTAVQGEWATFRIGNEQAIEVLGRDTLTLPYRVDGFNTDTRDKWGHPAVAEGEAIDHACLLKIRLTNFDLLRLGISPLQDFTPRSVRRHNAWMTFILRAALEAGQSDDCFLMLREHPGTKPLLWAEK